MPAPTMFVLSLVACLAALAAVHTAPSGKPRYDLNDAPNIYRAFVKTHSKVYDAEEYKKRFEIFKESLRRVNELNEKYDHTTFDIYHFADLTKEEMRNYMGLKYSPRNASALAPAPQLRDVTPPAHFNWRDQGVVTPVKNQGGCGSCYVFSAIGNIESQYAIKHKQCISLSEQQVLDCTFSGDCGGGLMSHVMQYVTRLRRRRAKLNLGEPWQELRDTNEAETSQTEALVDDEAGCMKESDYPYEGQVSKCRENKNKKAVTVIKGSAVYIPDEDYLLKLLFTYGPVSVALDAIDLLVYSKGILSPTNCTDNINHGVLLVGYGEENNRKFWIIKNSWGSKWGEKGYVRLERGVRACGIGTIYTAMAEVA